jgi:alpha-mannosidase
MQGPFEAEYSIIPHAGGWSETGAHRVAHAFNARLLSLDLPGSRPATDPWRRATASAAVGLPPRASLLEVDGDVEISAVKRAEDREELVVRLLNESAIQRPARMRPLRHPAVARRLNLAEEPGEPLDIDADGWISVELGPWEIATIGIELRP